jgi:hypothetical protein
LSLNRNGPLSFLDLFEGLRVLHQSARGLVWIGIGAPVNFIM